MSAWTTSAANNAIKAPEGGLALPLPYTVYERPTYSVVPSNAVWRDPARAEDSTDPAQERGRTTGGGTCVSRR